MGPAQNSPAFVMGVMKLAFLLSFAMFIIVVVRTPAPTLQSPNPTLEWSISTIAIISAIVGYFGRGLLGRMMGSASTNRTTSNPLGLWMTGNVFSLACIEACVLFGVVLHFVGARVRFVELLFSVGIIVLLIWSPGTPPTGQEGQPFKS